MAYKNKEISWAFVNSSWPPYVTFVGSPRTIDTFGQCRIAAENIARTLQQYFLLPKVETGKNRNEKGGVLARSLLVQPEAFLG